MCLLAIDRNPLRVVSVYRVIDNLSRRMHRLSRKSQWFVIMHTRVSTKVHGLILWRITVLERLGALGSAATGHSCTAQSVSTIIATRTIMIRRTRMHVWSQPRFPLQICVFFDYCNNEHTTVFEAWRLPVAVPLVYRDLHYLNCRLINRHLRLIADVSCYTYIRYAPVLLWCLVARKFLRKWWKKKYKAAKIIC